MTPLNGFTSTHDPEFQKEVLTALATLNTKMDLIVGEDGTGGFMAKHDERLSKLESFKSRVLGALAVITAGGGIVGAVVGVLRYFS